MKPRSWRPWIFSSLVLLLLLGCGGLLMWAIHQFGWDWTGFNGGYSKITIHGTSQDTELPQVKTLWDWLQLLIVPTMLAGGAAFFTWSSTRAERQIAQQRYEQDQELALDKQREDLLQSYLDRMAELLLEKGLRNSLPEAEVRKVARTRTVSTLIQLDGKRARTIFVFLREAQLTEESDPIVSFENADLSGAKWSNGDLAGFNLSGADLSGADLSGANLNRTNLSGASLGAANLNRTNLSDANLGAANLGAANLSRAHLSGADLSKTYLGVANLSGAYLSGADLSGADLSGVDLSKTNLTKAYLTKAYLGRANLSDANLSGANLIEVRFLEHACFRETILRGVKGLTPEQITHYKTSRTLVGEVTSSASPSQNTVVTSSQEAMLQASSSLGQVAVPTHVQEVTPEVASSQEHLTAEKDVTPSTPSSQRHSTPLSPFTEGTSPVSPLQESATPSLPSQDAAS